jgi:putative folate metabolism gamma-glutamate ligase
MKVIPLRTSKVRPGELPLTALLDDYVNDVQENSVLAITSKIVSLCENRVVPIEGTDKEELLKTEADLYLPSSFSKYGYHFAIKDNTLAAMAGIDESNGADHYILWPENSQKTANEVRRYLCERFHVQNVGVVIVDSTCTPLRRGTMGVALAHSGFVALHDYIGQPDLFGRPYEVSQSNVAGGLAATAVLVMGEGTEQTPLVMIEDIPFVSFTKNDPTPEEIAGLYMPKDEDLFAPFLNGADWQKGQGGR